MVERWDDGGAGAARESFYSTKIAAVKHVRTQMQACKLTKLHTRSMRGALDSAKYDGLQMETVRPTLQTTQALHLRLCLFDLLICSSMRIIFSYFYFYSVFSLVFLLFLWTQAFGLHHVLGTVSGDGVYFAPPA